MMKENIVPKIQVIQARGKLMIYIEHYCMGLFCCLFFFKINFWLKKKLLHLSKCDAPPRQVIQVKTNKSVCPICPLR